MDFKVGDVVILDNLDEDVIPNPGICNEMHDMLGKAYTISRFDFHGNWLELEDDPYKYDYHPSWFIHADGKKRAAPKKKKVVRKASLASKIKEVRGNLRKRAGTGVSNYGQVYEKNNTFVVDMNLNDICHARIGSYNSSTIHVLIDFIGKPKKRFDKKGYKQYLRFADYVINRSYVRNAYKPTTMSNYIQHGVMMNVEADTSEVMSACIALRMGSEKKHQTLPTFAMLTKKGFSEGVAFVLALSLKQKSDKTWGIHCPSGHHPFCYENGKDGVFKIAAECLKFPKKPFKNGGRSWEVFNSVGWTNNDMWGEWLKNKLEEMAGTKMVWGKKQLNPFTTDHVLSLAVDLQAEVDKIKGKK